MPAKPKPRKSARVTLPPLPKGWDDDARIEIADVDVDTTLAPNAQGGLDVIQRRARVWRLKVPRALQAMTPTQRLAMIEYAEAVETCASPGGASGPSGGGGGSAPGSRPPSLHRLEAAGRLRIFHAALAGKALEVALPGETPRTGRPVATPYATLAGWVAVDHLTRTDILQRLGFVPTKSDPCVAARGRIALATRDCADILAGCCGYAPTAPGTPQARNRSGHLA